MYTCDAEVPQETFAEVLLRTGKLAEAQSEGRTPFPATEGECGPTFLTTVCTYTGVLYVFFVFLRRFTSTPLHQLQKCGRELNLVLANCHFVQSEIQAWADIS